MSRLTSKRNIPLILGYIEAAVFVEELIAGCVIRYLEADMFREAVMFVSLSHH